MPETQKPQVWRTPLNDGLRLSTLTVRRYSACWFVEGL
jgi:hypothetical protein